jgi:hypothetical protein
MEGDGSGKLSSLLSSSKVAEGEIASFTIKFCF